MCVCARSSNIPLPIITRRKPSDAIELAYIFRGNEYCSHRGYEHILYIRGEK